MSVQYGSVISIGDKQGSNIENFDSDAEMILEEQSGVNGYNSNNNNNNDELKEFVTNENEKDIEMDEEELDEDIKDEDIKDVEDDILEIGVGDLSNNDDVDNDEELLDFVEEDEEENEKEEDSAGDNNDDDDDDNDVSKEHNLSVEVISDDENDSVDEEEVKDIEKNETQLKERIEESIEIFSDSEEVEEVEDGGNSTELQEIESTTNANTIIEEDDESVLENNVVPESHQDEDKTSEELTKSNKQKESLLKHEIPIQVKLTLPLLLETEVSRCFLLKPPDSIPMTREQLEYFPILFKDDSIISKNLDSLFELIRHTEELKDEFQNEDELILTIDQLELSISEDNYYAGEVSITDLINLKIKYNKKHKMELKFENLDELALTLKLSCQRRFITQFNKLCSESIEEIENGTILDDEHVKSDDKDDKHNDSSDDKQQHIKIDENKDEQHIKTDDETHEQDIISDEEDILDEVDEEDSNKRSFQSVVNDENGDGDDGDDDEQVVKKFKSD